MQKMEIKLQGGETMDGLGKQRTPFGKWWYGNGFNQRDLEKAASINKNTASIVCNDLTYIPGAIVMKKIVKAARKIDPEVRISDFWDL